MSFDRTLGDTFYMMFTTRSFTTGIPTTLAGTPVVSAYADNNVSQITAGITLSVDHDGVAGMNLLTIVATGGNGYATTTDYNLVITTGTVGGVSVVGEVVGNFSLSLSSATKLLGTPAGASVSADIASVKTDTGTTLPASIALLSSQSSVDAIGVVTAGIATDTSVNLPATLSLMQGTGFNTALHSNVAIIDTGNANWVTGGGGSAPTVQEIRIEMDDNSTKFQEIVLDTGTTLPAQISALNNFNPATDVVANVTTVLTTVNNTDMRGTDGAATPTQVNNEMLDVLTVDTFPELSNVPSATSSILDKVSWQFMLGRNKYTQTSTTQSIRNIADNADVGTSPVSDDGVTFIRGAFT